MGDSSSEKKIYKVVFTGGPCGGKTTSQARLSSFFETLGWKVLRVPETASVLLGGGIKFSELTERQGILFQESLLKTMMQIESVFFQVAENLNRNVLVICDRGAMDASAFITKDEWNMILERNNLNEVDIRDNRYNHVIHMVSCAFGAEEFYTTQDHSCRSEDVEVARELDKKAAQAWVGHPYFDVLDNSSDFESKLCRMINCVCQRIGIDAQDRLQSNTKKLKYLVQGPIPTLEVFGEGVQDFFVYHDYLKTSDSNFQVRLRRRGQNNHWSYTYTVRKPEIQGQEVEVKTILSQKDYNLFLSQIDTKHQTIVKKRRCFIYENQYFQMDMYLEPCPARCKGLIILETYSTLKTDELSKRLPKWLDIVKEVTSDPCYSMFNLSLKEDWSKSKDFIMSGSYQSDTSTKANGTENVEGHFNGVEMERKASFGSNRIIY